MGAGLDGRPHQPAGDYCPTCEQTFADGDRCPTDNTRLVRIAAPVDTLIGRELDGRYTIVEKLGQGGMGSVYRGTQHSVGREVAIKVVAPQLVSNADVIKRFLREAKLASRLVHPNAVAVLDFGQTDDNMFYLVMELVDGRTLDAVIAEGSMSPARLVRIGMQICDALEGAHALKIVHRDLKPQNVMVMKTGRDLVKVLDFGIAKSLTPDHATVTMTNAGALLGTPAYMPPELVGGQPVDARADLYSLGCMLFVAATGKLPFEAATVNEMIAMHACEPAPPVTGVPPRLAAVIGRLLEKEPADRFQTAAQTRDALEAALAGDAPDPKPEPDEEEQATKLGWSGHNTAFGKGQRPRISTPISGVKAKAPAVVATPAQSGRMLANTIPRDQQDAFASLPTLPVDSIAQLAVAPVSPVSPAKKSRKGLLAVAGAASVAAVGLVTFLAIRSPSATDSPTTPSAEPAAPGSARGRAPAPTTAEPAKSSPPPSTPTPTRPAEPSAEPSPGPAKPSSDPSLTTPIPTPAIGNIESGQAGDVRSRVAEPPPKRLPAKGGERIATPQRQPTKSSAGGPARSGAPAAPLNRPADKKEPEPPRAPITRNPGVM